MQIVTPTPLRKIWLKAAVAGSIWASIEIIIGSFLHNLKIPLSGMVLSVISVWLMISFLQIWRENGLIWRAGIICALMKSISPSAVILGPMTGILTEALLVELSVWLFGKNIFGYLIAGALAVFSTLIHKVISLLIIYGFDFLKILSDLYQFAVKQINIDNESPAILLSVISVFYIVAGMAGAAVGYLTGRRQSSGVRQTIEQDNNVLKFESELNKNDTEQNYAWPLLLINIIILAVILFLINLNYTIPAFAVGLIYVSFCIIRYKNSLRRLKKVSFWLSFLIITFTAAFLWKGFSERVFFSTEGLIAGLKINARAVILIIGFAAISVELKNPLIKSLLYNRGFSSLYQSLNLAFSALPVLISNISLNRDKATPGNLQKLFSGSLGHADTLLSSFEKEHLVRPDVVIVTGEVNHGKTTVAQGVISYLLERNIKIAGFLCPGNDENGERKGYFLQEIGSPYKHELCTMTFNEKRQKTGRFYFNQDTLDKGLDLLKQAYSNKNNELVVVDEIGPLELKNKGWSREIDNSFRNKDLVQLWIVRKKILGEVLRKWHQLNIYIFDIEHDKTETIINKIFDLIISHKKNFS